MMQMRRSSSKLRSPSKLKPQWETWMTAKPCGTFSSKNMEMLDTRNTSTNSIPSSSCDSRFARNAMCTAINAKNKAQIKNKRMRKHQNVMNAERSTISRRKVCAGIKILTKCQSDSQIKEARTAKRRLKQRLK